MKEKFFPSPTLIRATHIVGLKNIVVKKPVSEGDKRDAVQSLGQEDSLEEGMATHSVHGNPVLPGEPHGQRNLVDGP